MTLAGFEPATFVSPAEHITTTPLLLEEPYVGKAIVLILISYESGKPLSSPSQVKPFKTSLLFEILQTCAC